MATLVAPPAGVTETSDVATEVGPVVLPEQAMLPARIALTKALAVVRGDKASFLSVSLIVSTEGNLATQSRKADEAMMKGASRPVDDETGTRMGVEAFYTGPQALEHDPYRSTGRAYTTIGILVSQRIGPVVLHLNGENLTNVRQTHYDPLLFPTPGEGGRWTTDEWAPLEGRLVNLGIRIDFQDVVPRPSFLLVAGHRSLRLTP